MALPSNRKVVGGDHGRTGRACMLCTSYDGNDPEMAAKVEFANTSYNYTIVADEEEVTSSTDAGNRTYEYGNKGVEGHIEAVWDASENYFGSTPYLDPRGHYNMYLWLNAIADDIDATMIGPHLYVANMRISNIAVSSPVKGKLTIAFDFKSSGVFTLPGTGIDPNDENIDDAEGF